MAESPRDRIVRLFGLGKYGEKLTDEILGEFRKDIITDLHDAGLGLAATYLENKYAEDR